MIPDMADILLSLGLSAGRSSVWSKICVLHGIYIKPEWVPRSRNEQADYLSRIVDFDDWFVDLVFFAF